MVGFRTIVCFRCVLPAAAVLLVGCTFDESGVRGDAGAGLPDAAGEQADAREDAPSGDAAQPPADAALVDAAQPQPDAAGPPDATPPVDAPDDQDSDGIVDDEDNCPTDYNPEQYDEDGDGHGDVCDNCPSVFNVAQLDEQEEEAGREPDGVGDACDPRPLMSGDAIAFFDGFNGDALGPEWSVVGTNSWSVGGGRLQQSVAAGTRTLYYDVQTFSRADIATEITVHSIPPPANNNTRYRVGLLGQLTLSESYYNCIQVMDGNDAAKTTRWRLLQFLGNFSNLATIELPWTMQVGVPYSMWMAVSDEPAWQVCEISTPTSVSASQVTGSSDALGSGYVGLTTSGVTASIPFVVIYTLGPPA